MPKNKRNDDFADWTVAFTGATPPFTLTIRATSLHVLSTAVELRGTYGSVLFAAPLAAVLYVKRLEPGDAGDHRGEHVPAAAEQPKVLEAPPAGSAAAEKAADDPGPIEIVPLAAKTTAPRPRGSRRAK